MSKKARRGGHDVGRWRRWWPIAAGALFLAALAFSTGLLSSRGAAAESAPDITLTTLQGDFRLSQQRGETVVLYFSFVG